jgi:thiopeptide-type bacteriocin biosynthesis protein
MTERPWVSAHLFHSGDLDRLLSGAVRPLVAELLGGGHLSAYFFLRYWEGGSHLRLRLLPARADEDDLVRDLVAARAGRYLSRHPATRPVPAAEYATLAARLAAWERLPAYTQTLYPDNSVRFIAYRPEHERYGTGACLHAVERHFTDSSQIALALVSAGAGAPARQTTALGAALLAHFLCPAEGSIDEVERLVPDAAQRYAGQRDRLRGLAEAMRELAGSPDAAVPSATRSLRAWRESLVALCAALEPHAREVRVPEVVAMCVHLFCNRLGVSLGEEAYVRYLAGRTAADLHGRE